MSQKLTERTVKIAVVSDIHAATPVDKEDMPSYASTSAASSADSRDAIRSLVGFIEKNGLVADYIFSCGDMTDKSDPTAMTYIWGCFHDLANRLRAEPIATLGNHDIDSRLKNCDYDARGVLRGLIPPFPYADINKVHEFWSKNFFVVRGEYSNIVVLNSCAYHGYNPDGHGKEHLHGRISERTIEDIEKEIQVSPNVPVNVLLTHHHPFRNADIDVADYSEMQNGAALIESLENSSAGRWVIIHGHKHHPRICTSAGGSNSPYVVGAASLSSRLYPELAGRVRNQFHILTFFIDEAARLELDIACEIESWDYVFGLGWAPARTTSGLPALSGFGSSIQFKSCAKKLSNLVTDSGCSIKRDAVLGSLPNLRFALPQDFYKLKGELELLGLDAIFDQYGILLEIGRKGS